MNLSGKKLFNLTPFTIHSQDKEHKFSVELFQMI